MKYLMKFKEGIAHSIRYNIDQEILNLQEFCEINLAYLIDEGFNIKIVKTMKHEFRIKIEKDGRDFLFYFTDVKDYIIPFLVYLKKEYKIESPFQYNNKVNSKFRDCITIFWESGSGGNTFSIDDIFNDKVNNRQIRSIEMIVSLYPRNYIKNDISNLV